MVTEAADSPERQPPARRVVMLGASNLTRGISTVVETARRMWGRPLDVLAALGHGRSFNLTSRVLGRSLPGILQCGLWDALDQRPAAPTAALITDIGNDILYGAAVEQIAAWVEQSLQRLSAVSEKLIVTQLPLDNITRLTPRRFAVIRRSIFPTSGLKYDDAMSSARALHDCVATLAERYGAQLVRPLGAWYGWDPIHIRARHWPRAWQEILASWNDDEAPWPAPAPRSWRRWIALRRARPLQRKMFGVTQRRRQPALRMRDGTWISFY